MTLATRLDPARHRRSRAHHRPEGLTGNPFPGTASRSTPHLANPMVDDPVYEAIAAFTHRPTSQMITLEVPPGCGATHTLTHLARELHATFGLPGLPAYYARYVQDPRNTFAGILQQAFTPCLPQWLVRYREHARGQHRPTDPAGPSAASDALRALARCEQPDAAVHVHRLTRWFLGYTRSPQASGTGHDTGEGHQAAVRTLTRTLQRHDALPLTFLLLDRFRPHPQDPAADTARFLSALRRTLNAMPANLLIVTAAAPDQVRSWPALLPAIRSALATRLRLPALERQDQALALADHYLAHAQAQKPAAPESRSGVNPLLTGPRLRAIYDSLAETRPYVSHQAYLQALNLAAADLLNGLNQETDVSRKTPGRNRHNRLPQRGRP